MGSVLFDSADPLLIERRPPRSIVAASADPVAALIDDLGGDAAVVGLYLADQSLAPGTLTLVDTDKVSAWRDVRASGGGPSLNQGTAAARPPFDGTSINFDGVDDVLVSAAAGRLAEITTSRFAIAIVTERVSADNDGYCDVAGGAAGHLALARFSADNVQAVITGLAASGNRAIGAGVRVIHGRRTQSGQGVAFCRVGSAAEVSSAAAGGGAAALTALRIGQLVGFGFGDARVRAVLVYKGDDWTSAAKYDVFNAFAAAELGATV